mgnify:CR=1 FL=1
MAVDTPVLQAIVRRELGALGAAPWSAAVLDDFVNGSWGAEYGVSAGEKKALAERFVQITQSMESGTSPLVHSVLAKEIMSLPPDLKGDVIECGVWKGASTAALSLVCQRVSRRLKVCDSFQGLPPDHGQRHVGLHTRVYGYYQEGMFRGTLEEVKEAVRAYGALEVCDFIPGFFSDSLRELTEPIVFAFLDVDLESSTRDCLKAIWPLLAEEGLIYSDDAGDLEVVRVYFDDAWWREQLHWPAPGFVGSGCGLPLSPSYSSLGYTRKLGVFREEAWKRAPFLHYPGSDEQQ